MSQHALYRYALQLQRRLWQQPDTPMITRALDYQAWERAEPGQDPENVMREDEHFSPETAAEWRERASALRALAQVIQARYPSVDTLAILRPATQPARREPSMLVEMQTTLRERHEVEKWEREWYRPVMAEAFENNHLANIDRMRDYTGRLCGALDLSESSVSDFLHGTHERHAQWIVSVLLDAAAWLDRAATMTTGRFAHSGLHVIQGE